MIVKTLEQIIAEENAEKAYRNMIENEKLMTKKDAIKVLNNIVFGLVDTGQAERWIDALECLGLIKFKEERKTTICFMGPDDRYVEIWKDNKLNRTIDCG